MRIVLQRVKKASVTVGTEEVGAIGQGLMLLLGVGPEDTEQESRFLAEKCVNLRIFEDDQGLMNRSLSDIAGEILVVSNFTLYGDCRKGRRPSFVKAARPELAQRLYEQFLSDCEAAGAGRVAHGIFGAEMQVHIENDGPVTLVLDTDTIMPKRN